MSLIAIVSNGGFFSIGIGVGSLFVSVLLVFLLGYLDLLEAAEWTNNTHRLTIIATIFPLIVTFAAVVLYQVLQIL